MISFFKKIFGIVSDAYNVLILLKVQLVVSAVACVLFLVPSQILEIYRLLSEDLLSRWPQAVMAVVGLEFLIFMIWYSGRWMTLSVTLNALNQSSLKSLLLRWLPRFFAIAPGLLLGGLFLVSPTSIGGEIAATRSIWVRVVGGAIILLSLIFLLGMVFRTRLFGNAGVYRVGVGGFQKFALRAALILPVVLFVLVVVSPIRFPEFVGTLFFSAVFLAVLTFVLSWSSLFARNTGFPMTFVVIGLAALWSFLDLNDNHRVRTVASKTSALNYQMEIGFRKWLEARSDFEYYKSKGAKYPIYVVAAEGGGIYAAHHAASFLARMQDICPSFSSHLFAISGVSGGSIGSTLFAGLLANEGVSKASKGSSKPVCKSEVATAGPLEQSVDKVLSHDLLSPLVAATLTKDFAQAFLPVPVGSFDRARALEDAVVAAWKTEGHNPDSLYRSVSDTWSPTGSIPALVLNTTQVESGLRVASAPFQLVWSGNGVQTMDRYLEDGRGLSLVSASALSARFTYITPAGWLALNSDFLDPGDAPIKSRFVDGGYFENSGVDTAMDMIEALEPMAKAAGAEIRLITLQYSSASGDDSYALGEALSPVRALLGTRTVRGILATRRAGTRLAGYCPLTWETTSVCDDFTDITDPVRLSQIHDGEGKLPLGWLLSQKSREIIARQIGWPKDCVLITGYVDLPPPAGMPEETHDNACNLKFIQIELEDGITNEAILPAKWAPKDSQDQN